MKKQFKKLVLDKRTISNLSAAEMSGEIGGAGTLRKQNTCGNNKTCEGHASCQLISCIKVCY